MFKTGHTLYLFPETENILSKYYLTLKEIYYNNILILIRDNNKFDNSKHSFC